MHDMTLVYIYYIFIKVKINSFANLNLEQFREGKSYLRIRNTDIHYKEKGISGET